MTELTNKLKIKFELQTFIVILVFVFGLGMARASLNAKQSQILVKLDQLASQQEAMVATRDAQHTIIDSRLGYVMTTLKPLAILHNLPVYEGL